MSLEPLANLVVDGHASNAGKGNNKRKPWNETVARGLIRENSSQQNKQRCWGSIRTESLEHCQKQHSQPSEGYAYLISG